MDRTSRIRLVRIATIATLLVAGIVAVQLLPIGPWLLAFQEWVRGLGAIGYVVYALAYVVTCVLVIPAAPLTLGAGAIFGFVKGSLVVVVGATLGATASFLLSRTVLRKRVEAMTKDNPRFSALDRAIAREGGRIVFLCRLAVVLPFTWLNFAFGLTGVSLGAYVVATFFGIIPATLAFVWVSSTAAEAATGTASTTRLAVNIAGAVAAIVVSGYVGRLATRAIREAGVDAGEPPAS